MKYIQTRKVNWIKTPKDTIWVGKNDYIQPYDTNLVETPLGVNLQLLLGTDYEDLFDPIYDLEFCPICYQMTNHSDGKCLKHI